MKVTGIIMFLITVTVAKHHHYSLRKRNLKLKGFFFGQAKEDVHVTMENIFGCLNLNTNFTKEPNIKLLLTMHRDLSNIADKNYDAFNDIQNITIVKIENHTQAVINLDKIVTKILNANNFNVYEKIKGRKRSHKHAKLNQRKIANDTSEFGDSREFMNFILDFVEKINKLTIKDFKKPLSVSKRFVSYRRNLKVWKPDSFNSSKTRRLNSAVKPNVMKFPFVVSIHIMGEFMCTGSLISRDIIITAASCLQVAYKNDFFTENPKAIFVRLGSDYIHRDGDTIPIQRLHFHPFFVRESLSHNLALVKLERKIRFKKQQNRIRRIMWDKTPGRLSDDTKNILVLGWGNTKSDQTFTQHKLKSDVLQVYNYSVCKNIYSEDFVSDESFCAGYVKTKGRTCNGGVGGPGLVGEVLIGVVSFGAPVCGSGNTPTVFTKLGYYAIWIDSILGPQGRQSQLESLYKNTRRNTHKKKSHAFENRVSTERKESHGHREEKTEEVRLLRDILNDLIQNNATVVDELLYGDLYEDFKDLFESDETVENIQHHSTATKSLFLMPDFQYDFKKDDGSMVRTTSKTHKTLTWEVTEREEKMENHGAHKHDKNKVHHGSANWGKEKTLTPKRVEIDSKKKLNSKNDDFKISPIIHAIGKPHHHIKKDLVTERSLMTTTKSHKQKNKYGSVEALKAPSRSSDSSESSIRKITDSEEVSENSNVRDSEKRQISKESSTSNEKKKDSYSTEKVSRSNEHSEMLRQGILSEQKPYSHETSGSSKRNAEIYTSDSSLEAYLTTKFIPGAGTYMVMDNDPGKWDLVGPWGTNRYMRNRKDITNPVLRGLRMTPPSYIQGRRQTAGRTADRHNVRYQSKKNSYKQKNPLKLF